MAVTLKWVFGFNKEGAVHSLADDDREAFFYTAANLGIIYEVAQSVQKHLIGHTNEIRCSTISSDKRWIVTADQGKDSLLIVWDSLKASAVKSIPQPYQGGIEALDISYDGNFIATISKGSPQYITIWEWRNDQPRVCAISIAETEPQTHIRFSYTNPYELISNGKKSVVFFTWSSNGIFETPALESDYGHSVGNITQSIFLPDSDIAISATTEGSVILWDWEDATTASQRKAARVLRMHDSKITTITYTRDYIVTGGAEGFVRFFDFQFRIVAWYEDLHAGPIANISFSNKSVSRTFEETSILASEFLVTTEKGTLLSVLPSIFEEQDIKRRKGVEVMKLHDGAIYGLAAHPLKDMIAISSYSGFVQIWDYGLQPKELKFSRKFEKLMGHCLSFDSTGNYLAVGFTNGVVKILTARWLKDVLTGSFRSSKEGIKEVVWSCDSVYLATSDMDKCVGVYRSKKRGKAEEEPIEWEYIGKYRSHFKPIVAITFGSSENQKNRLVSLGEDRVLVEYDLVNSSVTSGLIVKSSIKLEQIAIPTAMCWNPDLGAEDFIAIANDQYKLKLLNSDTKLVRKTVLGPTFSGPLTKIIVLPKSNETSTRTMVYATSDKVIGLIKIPFDGNPNKSIGQVAHPDKVRKEICNNKKIVNMVVSRDGRYLFTAGGEDLTVNMWQFDLTVFDENIAKAGSGIQPFIPYIEGGKDGTFWNEIKGYFHFAQIKHQGEDSTNSHNISNKIPLNEVPNVMRALGFYPTEKEVDDLLSEVRYAEFVETGRIIEEIDFEMLLRLYVNHKPVFGIGKEVIQHAFSILSRGSGKKISLDMILHLLQTRGEKMNELEMHEYLKALVGDYNPMLYQPIGAKEFSENILGFQDS